MRATIVAALSLAVLALWAPSFAAASEDPAADAAKLYDVRFDATPKVKKGAEGRLTVRIVPRGGAEIHKEAPINLALTGSNVTPGKAKLGRPELKMEGHDAAFDVPFTATATGQLDATLSFFICTDKICARQERKASLPVSVE